MNKYVKEFLIRGMMFSGLGPIVLGIIYAFLDNSLNDFSLSGFEVCIAIISTYFLAFIQAGATVFNQIESWSLPKSLLCHFSCIYIAYLLCYLANTWIPFKSEILLLFTLIFIIIYFCVWLTVYFTIKSVSRKMNNKLC